MGGDRGYFWNISKQTYIFEILIFFKYKKEKSALEAAECLNQTASFWKNGTFFFFIFKKIKILKIYVYFEISQNYTRSPPIGRQALSVIFFLQICNEVSGKKKCKGACRPPNGRQGPPPI